MTEPTIFNKMAHPEPSLSADTRSMLHDELWATVGGLDDKLWEAIRQMRADHGHQFIVIIDRVKVLEERVAALEGHVEMIADSCLVADQHYELRERVAALEEQLMSLDDDVAVLWSKNDEVEPREPLPKEDLD